MVIQIADSVWDDLCSKRAVYDLDNNSEVIALLIVCHELQISLLDAIVNPNDFKLYRDSHNLRGLRF